MAADQEVRQQSARTGFLLFSPPRGIASVGITRQSPDALIQIPFDRD